MKSNSKLRAALYITKYSVILLRCWPPRNPTRIQQIIFELSWWLMFSSSLLLLFPLVAAVYAYRNNSEIMTKSICLSCAVSQCAVKTLFCRIRRSQLQKLLEEMEDFVENPSELDRKILEKYISQCTVLHVGVMIWVYLTSISFIIGPFLIPQPFPTDAVYPFSVDNIYLKSLIYCHQSLVGLQTSAAVLLDCLVAVLLWFVCARFEALAVTIGTYDSFDELKVHIKHYQRLLRYTNDVKKTIDLFVFSTILTSVGGVLFSAIQFVVDQPLAIKGQYAVVAVTASVGLFICSWAADTLLQLGYLIGINIFQANWYTMEKRFQTCVMYLIAQSQYPITMKANHILPALSLQFFSQFRKIILSMSTLLIWMENTTLYRDSKSRSKIDPVNTLQFLRSLGRIWTVWPLDNGASRSKKMFHEVSLWFIILNLFFASITLWMSVCSCHKYPILMAKNLSQLMIINDSCSHLILYRIHRPDLGILIQEIFKYIETCKNHERSKLNEYFRRFLGFYMSLAIMYTIAALAFFCGAFILRKEFPIDAAYPFATDSALMSTIIYTHQTFSIVQNATLIMIDFLVITLFWYSGARMNILGCQLKTIQNDDQLKQCIQEHQEIIRFVQYTVANVHLIIYKTILIVAIIILSAGLQLIYYDAQIVVSQFLLIITVAILRIITYSSTIDEMKELNDSLRWKIYRSNWIQSCSNSNKNLQIFIHRCQKPIVILNGRMLNVMSLNFFAKLMYMSVSNLTTLRAIIEKKYSSS